MTTPLRRLLAAVTGLVLASAVIVGSQPPDSPSPAFAAQPIPSISLLDPSTGLNSTSHNILVTGSNLAGVTSAIVGDFEIQSDGISFDAGLNELTITVPRPSFNETPIGAVPVKVVNEDGVQSNSLTFTWLNPRFMLDNGVLRFGGGGENTSSYSVVDSLEDNPTRNPRNTGIPKQPFYKDGSVWRKLTFSDLGLNYAIGTEASSGNATWSGAKHVADAQLNNLRVRFKADDGTLLSPQNQTVVASSGTLYVDGFVDVNANKLRIEHEYFLGAGNNFARVTTRVTNIGEIDANNVHFWVGTRDDWVGQNTDNPKKTKGNLDLSKGTFSQIPEKTVAADALKIEANDGSILFFATPESPVTVNMTISSRNVDTLATTDPKTVEIVSTGDQAYAMVANLGNLSPAGSSQIVWYYAAANPDELDAVISAVAESAGGTASLDSATTQGGVLNYTVDFGGQTTSNEEHFVVVVRQGSQAPTAEQIEQRAPYSNVIPEFTAMNSDSPSGAIFDVLGLEESSRYTYYAVTRYDILDEQGETTTQFSDVTSGNFVTLPGAPLVESVASGDNKAVVRLSPSGNADNFRVSTDGGVTFNPRSPSSTASEWEISGLENGTEYEMQFQSVFEGRTGPATSSFFVTPRPPAVFLSDMEVSAGSLVPLFDANTFNYSLTVPNSVATITLTPTSDGNIITIVDALANSGEESGPIPIAVGPNSLSISVVSNETGALPTIYSLSVVRAAAQAAPAPPRPTATPAPAPLVQAPVTVPGRTTPVAPAPPPATVSGPVLRGNVAPTPPQQPVARVGDRDVPVTTQVNTPNRLDVRAGSVSLGVSVPQNVGGVRQQAGGPTELEVRSGGQTTLQGGGVLPGSTVQVFMPLRGDNAKQLAQITADPTGNFDGGAVFATQRTEPPLPIGRQVLQIVSVDDTGQQVVMEMSVVIAQPPPAPEFDRSADALPQLPVGQSVATEAGLPVAVQVRAETETRQAVIEADGWTMAIAVAGQDATVEETAEGGASLTFVRDEAATVQGSGFMPGTRADVWLFSEPTLLGSVTIDDNGEFNGEISVDGRVVAIGEHTLQLQGVGQDGYVRSANLGVLVKDPDAELATTADMATSFAWWFWIIGIIALLAIAVIAFWLYRRAQQDA